MKYTLCIYLEIIETAEAVKYTPPHPRPTSSATKLLAPNSTNTLLKSKHMHTLPLPSSQLHVDTEEFNIILLQVITWYPGIQRTRAGLRLSQSTRMREIARKRWLYFTYCAEQILYVNSYTALSALSADDYAQVEPAINFCAAPKNVLHQSWCVIGSHTYMQARSKMGYQLLWQTHPPPCIDNAERGDTLMTHINPQNKVPSSKWGNCVRQDSVSQTFPRDGTLSYSWRLWWYITSCITAVNWAGRSRRVYLHTHTHTQGVSRL